MSQEGHRGEVSQPWQPVTHTTREVTQEEVSQPTAGAQEKHASETMSH